MTEKTFKKKCKELQEEYVKYAEIRNDAMNNLQRIIREYSELERKYFGYED